MCSCFLLCVIDWKQFYLVKEIAYAHDPRAFVAVSETKETYGEEFLDAHGVQGLCRALWVRSSALFLLCKNMSTVADGRHVVFFLKGPGESGRVSISAGIADPVNWVFRAG